jgi:hypothetical protein
MPRYRVVKSQEASACPWTVVAMDDGGEETWVSAHPTADEASKAIYLLSLKDLDAQGGTR